jgi:hypothetical protein
MKSQKIINLNTLLLLTSFLFLASNIFAQQRKGPPRIPDSEQINKMVEDLSTELSLNEEQRTNIHDLYTEHFNEIKDRMEQNKDKQKMEREEMENHRKAFEDEVKSQLSEVQQDKFEEFMKKHKPHKKHDGKKLHYSE